MSSSTSTAASVNRSQMSSRLVLLCVGFFLWAALSATHLGKPP